jgi:hypothetical protein
MTLVAVLVEAEVYCTIVSGTGTDMVILSQMLVPRFSRVLEVDQMISRNPY